MKKLFFILWDKEAILICGLQDILQYLFPQKSDVY